MKNNKMKKRKNALRRTYKKKSFAFPSFPFLHPNALSKKKKGEKRTIPVAALNLTHKNNQIVQIYPRHAYHSTPSKLHE